MLFNSINFLIYFPICTVLYYVTPQRIKNTVLLVMSYIFYMSWSPKYLVLIVTSTFITWCCGFLVQNSQNISLRKLALAITIISNLAILFVFKYFNFFMPLLCKAMGVIGIQITIPRLDVLLPVGISFYTFQALGYAIDVYRGDVQHEKNLIDYALFISFFPQLVAGPIERSKNLLPQFHETHTFDEQRAVNGLRLMLWGMYKKVAVADLAALFVDKVYGATGNYGRAALILAVFLFTIQIYCDFSGYSDIARGAAMVLGFRLMENFTHPYLSHSVTEFWNHWHISLSTWLRDYVYIPLGGNKKGKRRKLINLMIVFLVSGLWHGASFAFLAWGGVHGILRVLEEVFKNVRLKLEKSRIGVFYCFTVVSLAWIFFRTQSFRAALSVFASLLSVRVPWNFEEVVHIIKAVMPNYEWGMWVYVAILVAGLLAVIWMDLSRKRGILPEDKIASFSVALRWIGYYCMICVVMFCFVMETNELGQAGAFLYFQF